MVRTFLAERRFDLLTVLLVVAGAVLRLMQPDLVLFKFDEATAGSQVLHMLQSRQPIPTGTESSVGALFPPLFDDLMLPPFLFSSSPVPATSYVAVINVLALLLGVALLRRYAGGRAAYFLALLYALSPWAVVYSRKIWDPYVISLFALLALAGLLLLLLEGRSWGGSLAVGSWLWLLQLHPSGALLAPVGLAALWADRAARPKRTGGW